MRTREIGRGRLTQPSGRHGQWCSSGRRIRQAVLATVLAATALPSAGCSFIFVETVPSNVEQYRDDAPISCTSGRVAPILDSLGAVFEVVRTAIALGTHPNDYEDAPISRGADIGFGLGFTALFAASAVYGFSTTGECREVKARALESFRKDAKRADQPSSEPPAPTSLDWSVPPGPSWARTALAGSLLMRGVAARTDTEPARPGPDEVSLMNHDCPTRLELGGRCLGFSD